MQPRSIQHSNALRLVAFAVATGSLVAGCQENPSYRLRWAVQARIDGTVVEPSVPPSATECSRVGLTEVEIQTYDTETQTVVDTRFRPCFPEQFQDETTLATGPELSGGNYYVFVRGLRRLGEDWNLGDETGDGAGSESGGDTGDGDDRDNTCSCSFDPATKVSAGICADDQRVCDCACLVVSGQGTRRIEGLSLVPPDQCEDGIDQDADGLVDQFDPGCVDGQEIADINRVQLRLRPSFLGRNPSATCTRMRVSAVQLEVRGPCEPGACTDDDLLDLNGEAEGTGLVFDCSTSIIAAVLTADTGRHELAVTALGLDGTPVTRPVTREAVFPAPEDTFLDFNETEFLEPIVRPAGIAYGFRGDAGQVFCQPPSPNNPASNDGAPSQVRIQVFDSRGNELNPPVLDASGNPLDGSDTPCTASTLATEELAWGGYAARVTGLSEDGDVCFESELTPLAPRPDDVSIVADRVEDYPESCP